MSQSRKKVARKTSGVVKTKRAGTPRCLAIAQGGLTTAGTFARFMSALISDLIEGTVSSQIGNAAVNAGGKLLKVVEMEHRYGGKRADGTREPLNLTNDAQES